jgi:hypothetical protein
MVIIYLGRQSYLTRKKVWDAKGIKADKETSAFFNKFIFIFTFILVIISLGLPQIIKEIVQIIPVTWARLVIFNFGVKFLLSAQAAIRIWRRIFT